MSNIAPILYHMISENTERKLPIPVEFYFDLYKNNYWIPYVHECLLANFVIWIAGFDSMILGFILCIHQQLDLLAGKISKIPEMVNEALIEKPGESKLNIEKQIFKRIIKQHQKIYE